VGVSPFAAVFSFPGNTLTGTMCFATPASRFRSGVLFSQREKVRSLFRWSEFRPQRQDFLHRSQPVRKLWVQGHTFQLISNPQPHQIVARKLRAGHALRKFVRFVKFCVIMEGVSQSRRCRCPLRDASPSGTMSRSQTVRPRSISVVTQVYQ
jgi:hypothetical protein